MIRLALTILLAITGFSPAMAHLAPRWNEIDSHRCQQGERAYCIPRTSGQVRR